MEFINQILDMVKSILGIVNEGEAAGIVQIVKDFLASFEVGGVAGILDSVKELLASLNEGEAAGIVGIIKDFIASLPKLL